MLLDVCLLKTGRGVRRLLQLGVVCGAACCMPVPHRSAGQISFYLQIYEASGSLVAATWQKAPVVLPTDCSFEVSWGPCKGFARKRRSSVLRAAAAGWPSLPPARVVRTLRLLPGMALLAGVPHLGAAGGCH